MSIAAGIQTDDAQARWNTGLLAVCQMLGGISATVVITLGGIIGLNLADNPALATLPVTAFVVGQALMTLPAGYLMKRVGRKVGFMFGVTLSMSGGLLAAYALALAHFWLFLTGCMIIGSSYAYVQFYRFAAADMASPAFKPKAISWVLIGGLAAAVLGPQTIIFSQNWIEAIPFIGSFLALSGAGIITLMVLSLLKMPPPVKSKEVQDTGRPLTEIARQKLFIVAVGCGLTSYALMSFVMTAAPLAMLQCNYGVADAALAIQWHAVAMFAPSFFTGHLIARFGEKRVIATGLTLLAGCAIVALNGISIPHFWGALILLGVGWNFGFVGATTLVTKCYTEAERNKTQALHDFLVFGGMAIASFLSGKIVAAIGWDAVNIAVFPFVVIALALLLLLARDESTAAPQAG
jgi:MFS family permease